MPSAATTTRVATRAVVGPALGDADGVSVGKGISVGVGVAMAGVALGSGTIASTGLPYVVNPAETRAMPAAVRMAGSRRSRIQSVMARIGGGILARDRSAAPAIASG